MALIGNAIGRIVSPIKINTSQNGKEYGQILIDFGTSTHPDHWYTSAWDKDIIQKCKGFHSGQRVILSGPVRKWDKPMKGSQVALNIDTIELINDGDYSSD
jgi:hypothetical protein